MEKIDTVVRHTTKANGNVFIDLGFPFKESIKLKLASQKFIRNKTNSCDNAKQ